MRFPPRLVAACCALIGVWFAALVPGHPNILTGDMAEAVLDDPLWELTHALMALVGVAGVVVAIALVERAWLLGVTILSAMATTVAGAVEATAFPLLAQSDPSALGFDGTLIRAPVFVAATGPWLLFPLCLAAIGWFGRDHCRYRIAGTTLAASGVAFFALGMWFVPVVGPASSVALGVALLAWAVLLWNGSITCATDPLPPRAVRGQLGQQ